MTFWDASAVVALLVKEPASTLAHAWFKDDSLQLVWWATEIECASALARLESEGALGEAAATTAFERLRQLSAGWQEVAASDAVRETAVRLLRVHPLRAADATQLAAAFVAAERRPASLEVVTLDLRLAAAARKEGFPLVEVRA
jgi:predicted nucleic acid-binding protein